MLHFILYSYSLNTSITGLSNHLQHEHSYEKNGKAAEATQSMLLKSFFNTNDAVKMHPTVKSKEERERLLFSRHIVIWICRDLLPFTLVCSEGFNYFWNKFNTKKHLTLPSRTTVAGQALDDSYTCMKNRLIDSLKNAQQHGCITFDSWTDSHKRISYLTFTYHFIDKNWKMFNTVLKTVYFEAPHTAQRIREMYNKMLEEFKLLDKKLITVTDGGSNVKSACNLIKVKRLSCVAHQINRLIQFDLFEKNAQQIKPICDLIEKLRKIQRSLIYKFDQLSNIYKRDQNEKVFLMLENLETIDEYWTASEQFVDNVDVGSFNGIKSFNTVRWSCVYILVKFHRDYLNTVKKCLEDNYKHELVLNLSEVQLLNGLVKLLECFHDFTKIIQGNSYPTQNILPLLVSEAQRTLKNIIDEYEISAIENNSLDNETELGYDGSVIATGAKILLENIDKRMELTPVSIVAAIVDPAMQHLPIIDEWLQKNSMSLISYFSSINFTQLETLVKYIMSIVYLQTLHEHQLYVKYAVSKI